MSLPDFLKLHEFTIIVSDIKDEELEKARRDAEKERNQSGSRR